MKTYQITVTEDQAKILIRALDTYARIGTGQLDIIDEIYRHELRLTRTGRPLDHQNFAQRLYDAKALLEYPPGASAGINNPAISDGYRVAYDMNQVVRNAIWQENNGPEHSVDAYVSQTSNVPLASVKAVAS